MTYRCSCGPTGDSRLRGQKVRQPIHGLAVLTVIDSAVAEAFGLPQRDA